MFLLFLLLLLLLLLLCSCYTYTVYKYNVCISYANSLKERRMTKRKSGPSKPWMRVVCCDVTSHYNITLL